MNPQDQTNNQENQGQEKKNDKEYNFRQIEARLQQERQARLQAEEALRQAQAQASTNNNRSEEDDVDDEPYVGHKKLDKKFANFEKKMSGEIDRRAEEKARGMIQNEKKESWLRSNPDFYEVLGHAEKFAERDPELAETILQMPEGFERQKLVYRNIKSMGLDKPAQKQPSIQEKIDSNKRSPYYQPSGVSAPGYEVSGDFSAVGQKNAYQKMQELKNKLRI